MTAKDVKFGDSKPDAACLLVSTCLADAVKVTLGS